VYFRERGIIPELQCPTTNIVTTDKKTKTEEKTNTKNSKLRFLYLKRKKERDNE